MFGKALIVVSATKTCQTEKCETEKWQFLFFCLTFFCLVAETMIKTFGKDGAGEMSPVMAHVILAKISILTREHCLLWLREPAEAKRTQIEKMIVVARPAPL